MKHVYFGFIYLYCCVFFSGCTGGIRTTDIVATIKDFFLGDTSNNTEIAKVEEGKEEEKKEECAFKKVEPIKHQEYNKIKEQICEIQTGNNQHNGFMYEIYSQNTNNECNRYQLSDNVCKSNMFKGNSTLKEIIITNPCNGINNLSGFCMNCDNLQYLNIMMLNTTEVTNMRGMFSDCSSLKSLNLSNFNTSKVEDMNSMFANCSSLKDLKLSSFNTQNVTDMGCMFTGCSSLTSLNLSNFKTGNVTDMREMFYNCSSLKELDLSSFNTNNVKNVSFMFYNCGRLRELHLGKYFYIDSKAVKKKGLFYFFDEIKTLEEIIKEYEDITCDVCASVAVLRQLLKNSGNGFFGNEYQDKDIVKIKINKQTKYGDYTQLEVDANNNNNIVNNKSIVSVSDNNLQESDNNVNSVNITIRNIKDNDNLIFNFKNEDRISNNNINNKINNNIGDGIDNSNPNDKYNIVNIEFANQNNIYVIGIDKEKEKKIQSILVNSSLELEDYENSTALLALVKIYENCYLIYCKNANSKNRVGLFSNSKATEIKILSCGRDIKNMRNMFANCSSLESLDLYNLNTANVTDMNCMFADCSSLTSLDLKNFNTNKVTDMSYMFSKCTKLTELDLSQLNTEKVDNMGCMFAECKSLTNLDLKHFNTKNVTNMTQMFYGCVNLQTLYVSNFNTKNVTDMSYMFSGCSILSSLNLSNWNTNKVKDMRYMFSFCSSLTSLNLSNFKTNKVTNMSFMFFNCSSLTSLDLSNFNTNQVNNMMYMFSDCNSLTSLNLSNFNTSKVEYMNSMFYNCNSLTSLNLSSFKTDNVTDMSYMFANCSSLTSLDLSNFDTAKVIDMGSMFNTDINIIVLYGVFKQMVSNVKLKDEDKIFENLEYKPIQNISENNNVNNIGNNGATVFFYNILFPNNTNDLNKNKNIINNKKINTESIKANNKLFVVLKNAYKEQNVTNAVLNIEDIIIDDKRFFVNNGKGKKSSISISYGQNNVQNFSLFDKCSENNCGTDIYYSQLTDEQYYEICNLSFQDESKKYIVAVLKVNCKDCNDNENDKNTESIKFLIYCKNADGLCFNKIFPQDSINIIEIEILSCGDNITDMGSMFKGCTHLKKINLKRLKTNNVTNMYAMFQDCPELATLDLSSFNTENVENMDYMFEGCWKLRSLDLTSFKSKKDNIKMEYMFFDKSKFNIQKRAPQYNSSQKQELLTACSEFIGNMAGNMANTLLPATANLGISTLNFLKDKIKQTNQEDCNDNNNSEIDSNGDELEIYKKNRNKNTLDDKEIVLLFNELDILGRNVDENTINKSCKYFPSLRHLKNTQYSIHKFFSERKYISEKYLNTLLAHSNTNILLLSTNIHFYNILFKNKIVAGSVKLSMKATIYDDCINACFMRKDYRRLELFEFSNIFLTKISVNYMNANYIKRELDKDVYGQDKAKKSLINVAINHYKSLSSENNMIQNEVNNILIMGPSGSGKTLLSESIAKIMGLPYITISLATLIGKNNAISLQNILADGLSKLQGDTYYLEKAIVFIDEFDKIFQCKDNNSQVLQKTILELLNNRSQNNITLDIGCRLENGIYIGNRVSIKTSNMLFIFSGAFTDLERKIKEKNTSYQNETNVLEYVTNDDLLEYGIPKELISRLSYRTSTQHITKDEAYKIINMERGPLNRKINDIKNAYKCNISMDRDLFVNTLITKLNDSFKCEGARPINGIMKKLEEHIIYNKNINKEKVNSSEVEIYLSKNDINAILS